MELPDYILGELIAGEQKKAARKATRDSHENATRAEHGEYSRMAVPFFESNRKMLEVEVSYDSDSPFAGRSATSVAQGFRLAFKRAGITTKTIEVLKRM